jgi:hypothetical protein
MPIVCNSGPLISLGRIEQLALLPSLYNHISVPPAVYDEITRQAALPGANELANASWLHVVEVANRHNVTILRFWLDAGESEAVVLAQEMGATLLIDERHGRTIAHARGLSYSGTIGVLLAAKARGEIKVVRPLPDNLVTNGVRVSSRLYQAACQLAGE